MTDLSLNEGTSDGATCTLNELNHEDVLMAIFPTWGYAVPSSEGVQLSSHGAHPQSSYTPLLNRNLAPCMIAGACVRGTAGGNYMFKVSAQPGGNFLMGQSRLGKALRPQTLNVFCFCCAFTCLLLLLFPGMWHGVKRCGEIPTA